MGATRPPDPTTTLHCIETIKLSSRAGAWAPLGLHLRSRPARAPRRRSRSQSPRNRSADPNVPAGREVPRGAGGRAPRERAGENTDLQLRAPPGPRSGGRRPASRPELELAHHQCCPKGERALPGTGCGELRDSRSSGPWTEGPGRLHALTPAPRASVPRAPPGPPCSTGASQTRRSTRTRGPAS